MNYKNSKKQGDFGLGQAIAYYTKIGCTVCVPLTDSQDYDLVIEDLYGTLKRIQVKTSRRKISSGSYEVQLSVSGGNSGKVQRYHTELKYDELFVIVETGAIYVIPHKEIASLRRTITLGKSYNEFRVCEEVGESCVSVKHAPSAE